MTDKKVLETIKESGKQDLQKFLSEPKERQTQLFISMSLAAQGMHKIAGIATSEKNETVKKVCEEYRFVDDILSVLALVGDVMKDACPDLYKETNKKEK